MKCAMNTVVTYEKKLISFSQQNPIMLVELYTDTVIQYGVQFVEHRPVGLLITSTTKNKIDNSHVAEGAFCIHTNRHSDNRFVMPSPNVSFQPLTMHRLNEKLNEITRFNSLAQALMEPQILNSYAELSLDIYAHVWRSAGANIGRKVNNKIKWEKPFHLN